MATDGSLKFDTKIDNSGIDTGIKKIKTDVENTGSKITNEAKKVSSEVSNSANNAVKNISSSMSSIVNIVKGVALGYTGKTLVQYLIGSNADMEQYLTSFEVLLGSADKAKDLMTNLVNMANVTPFETTDLTDASKQLLAYGENVNNLLPDLQMLGDISLGNKDKFASLALVYGQVQSAGKLMGQDLLQLVNVGFNPLQIISQQTGESMLDLRKDMENGTISFDMVKQAMQSATSEGGLFYQGLEKQSQTMNGMLSTLKDYIAQAGRDIGDDAFEQLEVSAKELLNTLNEAKENGNLAEIEETISSSLVGLVTVITNTIETIYKLRDVLLVAGTAWATFKTVSTVIPIITSLATGMKVLSTVIQMGATKQVTSNIIDGTTVILKNKMTGAITLETAAKYANATATEKAKYEQIALNTAMLANPATWVAIGLTALTAAITGVALATSAASQKAEEARQKAIETGNAYKEQSNTLSSLISQYTELSNSETQNTSTKEQLKSIQDQLISTFGDEASGIDLVNGKYEDQIGVLQNLSVEKAQETIRNLLSDYNNAVTEMSKTAIDDLGTMSSEASRIFDGIEGVQGGQWISGTAEERLKVYNEILDKANQLDNVTKEENNVISQITQKRENLKKIIDDSNTIIQQYTNAELNTDYADQINNLKNAQIEYNNALKSQDNSKMEEAKTKVNEMREALLNAVGDNDTLKQAATNAINSIIGSVEEVTEADNNAANTAAQNMSDVQKNIETLGSALVELNENKKLNADTLDTLIAKYPDLINSLGSEKDLQDALIAKEQEEKSNYLTALTDKIASNGTFANNVLSNNEDLINDLAQAYGTDKDNFKDIANIKQEIDNLLRSTLGDGWSKFYGSQTEALQAYINNMTSIMDLGPLRAEQSENLKKAQASLNALVAVQKAAASYTPKTVNLTSGAEQKAAASAAKSAASAAKKAASEEEKAAKSAAAAEEKAATEAETARKNQVQDYKDWITETERLNDRELNSEEGYDQLSEEEKEQYYEAQAQRYRDYAADVENQTYMTNAEKLELEQEYNEKAEDLDLEAYKTRKEIAEKARDKEFTDLKNDLDLGVISEDDYYTKLAALRDKYFEVGSDGYEEYTLEIKKHNKELKDALLKSQQDMIDKLSGIDELYTTKTTTFKGLGFKGSDLVFTDTELTDFSKTEDAINEYDELYQKFLELNPNQGLIDKILGMDRDTAIANLKAIFSESDDEITKWLNSYDETMDDATKKGEKLVPVEGSQSTSTNDTTATDATASGAAATADTTAIIQEAVTKTTNIVDAETQAAIDEMTAKLTEFYGSVPEGFFDCGKDCANSFGDGLLDTISNIMALAKSTVEATMADMTPTSVLAGIAASNISYTSNYNFYSSGETTSQQLRAAKAAAKVEKLRGGYR